MGLVDLFRPRYRHSDVSVRSEAVRALSAEDAVVLTTIAKSDRDAGVRRLAIEKLREAEVLADIAASESDSTVRAFAKARAAELWTSAACGNDADAATRALSGILKLGDQSALVDLAVRANLPAIKKRALAELREPRALAELAKGNAPVEVRLEAVARIDDAEALRALAIDVAQKEIALAAVEKLDDAVRLEQVAQKAKNKAARQRARKIVTEMQEAEEAAKPRVADELKRRRAEKSQLVRDLEALSETFEFAKLAPQVKAAEQSFAEIGDTEDDLDERFKKSAARFWQRKERAEQQAEGIVARRSEAESERAEAAARKEQERARRDEERKKEREEEQPQAAPLDPAAAAAAAAAREEREKKRAEAAAKAKEEADAKAAKAKEDAERGKQIAASLSAMVGEMEQLLAADTGTLEGGKVIDRTLSQAQKAFEQLGKVPSELRAALGDRYGATRGKLVVLVKDLREAEDWQRWANVPRAEALINEAKAMLEIEDLKDLGNKLKALQGRWKEIGSLPQRRSKEMWEQFKASCDQVYDKVKGVRAVEQAAFAEVIAAKEKLINAAEELADSTDWQATAAKLKELQNEWKTTGHLPRKQGDELWKRFRAACDKFFERRKPLLEEARNQEQQNLQAKRALIAKVQSVVNAAGKEGSDWGKAIRDVKEAQRQWKEVGFVPRAESDAIYREFRAACDALFAKRDEARDAEANERRAALEAVSGEIDAVLALEDGADAAARAAAVRAKVTELSSDGSRPSIELAGRLDRMISHIITTFPDAVRGTALDPAALRKRRDQLIARAVELLPKESASAAADKPSDVAGALRSAMRQNAFSGLRFSGRDPAEVIEELRAEWSETGPLFDDSDRDQQARFDDTIARVLAAAGATERKREDRPERSEGGEGGERGGRRRERRDRRDRPGAEAAPAAAAESTEAAAAAAPAAVVAAATAAPAVAAAAAAPDAATARSPRTEPIVEAQDAAWDLDDHRPQAAAQDDKSSPPGAGELADDGAPAGDGIDSGWD
jgi:Domain of Unknown Function (DUF349)